MVGEANKPPGLRNSPPGDHGCRGWPTTAGCRYGELCKFSHTGPGKLAPPHQQWPRREGQHAKGEVKGAEHDVSAPPHSSSNAQHPASSNSLETTTDKRVKGADRTAPPQSPPVSKCNYCNGQHLMRNCPALATDNDAGTSKVHMVSGTSGVDHVFMAEQAAEQAAPMPASGNSTVTCVSVFAILFAIVASMILTPPPSAGSLHQCSRCCSPLRRGGCSLLRDRCYTVRTARVFYETRSRAVIRSSVYFDCCWCCYPQPSYQFV